jgi:transposase InsO family protein
MLTRGRARALMQQSEDARGGAASARVAGGRIEISPGSVPNGDDTDYEEFDMDFDGGEIDVENNEVTVPRALPRASKPSRRERTAEFDEFRQADDVGSPDFMRSTGSATATDRRAGGARPLTEAPRKLRAGSERRCMEPRARKSGSMERDFFASNVKADTYQRPLKWIKPDKYAALTPIESYISHFETVSAYNGWSAYDKVAHLKASLSGDAAQLLWDGGDHTTISYDALVAKLKARFGSAEHRERYACQLRLLKRQANQSLQQLYNEVRKLMALAYPHTADSELSEIIARDAFLSALGDRELEIKVRDREPADLDSAFRAAARIETYLRPVVADADRERETRGHRERFDVQRARQVKERTVDGADDTGAAMRDLREQLNRSLKMQEELSREVGRMRTLVECRSEAKKAVSAELAERVENGTRGNPPASDGMRSQASGRACFNCGDLSHFARNCPLRRSNERDAPGANGSAVATRTSETSDDKRVRILDVERLDRAAYLRMMVQGESVSCLLDTSSEVCLFPGRYAKVGDPKSNRQRLFAANGTEISVLGEFELGMSVGPIRFTVRGLCSNNVAEIILGLNFLREQEVVWDFAVGDVFLRGQRFELHARSGVNACRRVILESEVSIPPRSEVMAVANVEFSGRFDAGQTWATRSRQVTEHVHAASSVLPNRAVDVPIRILNAGHETVTLGVGTEITTAEPVTIEKAQTIRDDQQARWLETMEEFNFTVEHRAGRLHCNADAMSRIPCNNRRRCPPQDRDTNGRTDGVNGWVEGGDMRADTSGDQLTACSVTARDIECPRTGANYQQEVDRRADADTMSLDRPDEVTDGARRYAMRADASGDQLTACNLTARDIECPRTGANYQQEVDRRADADTVPLDRPDEVTDGARRYTMRADTGGTLFMNGDGATDDTLCKHPFDGWPDADVKRAETLLKIPEDRRWAEGSEKSAETLLEGLRAVRTADGNNDSMFTRVTVTDGGSTETRAIQPVTLTGRGDDDLNRIDGHGARSRPDEAGVRWQDEKALAELQRADPDLTEIIQLLEKGGEQPTWDNVAPLSEAAKILWRQWSRLMIKDGILVRRFQEASGKRGHLQAILPRVLRSEFIAAVHAGVAGGHFGRHRTELAVQARAYWPGWAGDVRRALKTCNACSRYLRGKPPRQVNLRPIVCGEPWELLSIDITGPHPTSRQGHNYILTLQDHFSKWAEAVPIRRHTAPIIARIIFEQVFMRFGAPRRILTDQGPEFESGLFSDLCNLMGVEKVRTTPYRPQTNGMIERMHRVLNAMLAKVISEDQRNWPEHLPAVMAAYRASTPEATSFSPNRLILGREVRLPVDTIYGLPFDRVNVSQSYDDIVCERAERTIFDFHVVRDCLKRAAQLRQDKYDIKVKPVAVEVGQKVWYYCPRRKMNVSPKWQNCYSGPYTVVRVIDPHVIVIARSRRSKPFTVHRDKLKLVVEDDDFDISGGQNLAKSTENQTTAPSIDAENAGRELGRVSRPRRLRKAPSKYDGFVRVAVIPVSDSGSALADIEMASTGGARGDKSRLWCASCHSSYRDARDLARHFRTAAHHAMEAGDQTPNRSRSGIATRQVSSLRRQQSCDAQTPVLGQECLVRLVRMDDAARPTEIGDGERPENRPSGAGGAETDAVAESTDTVIDGSSAESESRAAATGVKSTTTAIDPVWTAAMAWLHATASAAEGFGLHFSTDAEAGVASDVFKEISSFVRRASERVTSVAAERSDGRTRLPTDRIYDPTCDIPMAVEATLSNVRSSASAENIPMRVSTPADSENADPLLSASAMHGSSSCETSVRASPRVDIDSSYV